MSLEPAIRLAWTPPTPESLQEQAADFFKKCKPKEYKEMLADGSLAEVCHLRAERAEAAAKSLILNGAFDRAAWNQAVRSVILETESE